MVNGDWCSLVSAGLVVDWKRLVAGIASGKKNGIVAVEQQRRQ